MAKVLLDCLQSAAKPAPYGDESEWKSRTGRLVEEASGVIEKIPGSNDKLRAAAHFVSCHHQHGPNVMAMNDPRHDPNSAVPLERRRAFRPLAPLAIVVVVYVVCFLGYLAYAAWGRHSKQSVASCRSDCLSHLRHHLYEYAYEHDNQLPPADELLSVASGELGQILGCEDANLPFQWDFRLAGKRLDEIDGRALAWCPPGGHGEYVGVIVVEQGKLRARTLTIAELRSLVGDFRVK